MVVRETLLSNGMAPTGGRDWLIQWSGPGLRDAAYQEPSSQAAVAMEQLLTQ